MWRHSSRYPEVKITASPDIHDSLRRGVWKIASEEVAWSEACLGQKCHPEWEDSVRLGGDAGTVANPVTFRSDGLTRLRWPWDLSACAGVSGTVPACPMELCSCTITCVWKRGLNYIFKHPNNQAKSAGWVVSGSTGDWAARTVALPIRAWQTMALRSGGWWRVGKIKLALQMPLTTVLSVPRSRRMCARGLACRSPEPLQSLPFWQAAQPACPSQLSPCPSFCSRLSVVCSGFVNLLIALLGCAGPRSPGLWQRAALRRVKLTAFLRH